MLPVIPNMKKCSKCQQIKHIADFSRNKSRPTGYDYVCKTCKSKEARSAYSGPKALIKNARNRAKKKGFAFNLDEEFIQELREQQSDLCALSGIPLNWDYSGPSQGQRICPEDRASIDRIDSLGGYTKDNVQLVTDAANRLKGSSTVEELKALCWKILLHTWEHR